MASHLTTGWARAAVSDATRKHLQLGSDHVWSRMFEGLAQFLILKPGRKPKSDSRGYHDLGHALSNRGLR